jgi:hypothetical protein
VRLAVVASGPAVRAAPAPADLERIRAAVARSRGEQGLAPTIQDPNVLARVAEIFKLTGETARPVATQLRSVQQAA